MAGLDGKYPGPPSRKEVARMIREALADEAMKQAEAMGRTMEADIAALARMGLPPDGEKP